MIFLVRCPECTQTMKCAPRTEIAKAVKKCVYCNRNFKLHPNVQNSRILKRV